MSTVKNSLNHVGLLEFLWIWRKPIIIITLIGAVASVIITLMMDDYYEATAVIAPTRTTSVEFGANAKNNIGEFGDEEDALRLIMILESPEIRDSLVDKYDLYMHYEIDTSETDYKYEFQKQYNNNVSFERTRENAIEISVLDKEPEVAMNMANDIIRLVDTVMNRMIRESAKTHLWAVQNEVALIRKEMGDYQDKLGALRDSGTVGDRERSDLYTSYIEAKKLGDEELGRDIKRKIVALEKFGSDYDINKNLSDGFNERYVNILDVNDQAKQYASTKVRQAHVRNYAELPVKKSYPKRMIIVLLSTIGAFIFACVLVILLVRFKEIRDNTTK